MLKAREFEAMKTLKAQVHADFVAEITSPNEDEKITTRTLFVDGFLNSNSSGTWVIIENKDGFIVKDSLGLFSG